MQRGGQRSRQAPDCSKVGTRSYAECPAPITMCDSECVHTHLIGQEIGQQVLCTKKCGLCYLLATKRNFVDGFLDLVIMDDMCVFKF